MTKTPEDEAEQTIQKNLRTGDEKLSISFIGLADIPESIAQLTHLKTLYLEYNQLTNIPDAIIHLPNLQQLYLQGNDELNIPAEVLESRAYRHHLRTWG
jgi:hypothetical protein